MWGGDVVRDLERAVKDEKGVDTIKIHYSIYA